jgi:hypothetical protein
LRQGLPKGDQALRKAPCDMCGAFVMSLLALRQRKQKPGAAGVHVLPYRMLHAHAFQHMDDLPQEVARSAKSGRSHTGGAPEHTANEAERSHDAPKPVRHAKRQALRRDGRAIAQKGDGFRNPLEAIVEPQQRRIACPPVKSPS